MFLKSLTIKGFKSFADSTTLHLEPGVTVVVGPNGSGKSNVVDAIAWVLGAQAPSAVRSQKMDDVIFAGTAKRPALGRAEVILTLDNSAGLLPIEFTEVTIARTLFRTGESEYAINGVGCRLLDVQELLSDAGVGRQQHVIVSQGQIDAVLNARPEERRSIIEEAAGVLKFRRRKEKSERRLDSTDVSLTRVQDLLREVRRQLRPLERQAEAAKRHGDLVAELDHLRLHLRGREIVDLRARLDALAADRTGAATDERRLRDELAELERLGAAAEAELAARGDTDLGDEMVQVEHLRERARGLAALIGERRRSLERDRGQLMDSGVVANLEADGNRVRAELGQLEADLSALGPQAEALGEEEAAFAAHRHEVQATLDGSAGTAAAATAAAEVRAELRSVIAGIERGDGDHRRLVVRRDATRERLVRLREEIAALQASSASADAEGRSVVADLDHAGAARVAAEADTDAATAAREAAAGEVSRWKARAEALQLALEHARARAGAEHLDGVEGALGTLFDLIEIDEGWETAVEAALGDALLAVVVADAAAGRRALTSLAGSNVHGAVLALGTSVPAAPAAATGSVRAHVRSADPQVSRLLDAVLAPARLAPSWSEALDAAVADPAAVVVTPDGDRFGPTGWRLRAVERSGATAAALDEAVEHHQRAESDLQERTLAADAARARLQAARAAEIELTRRVDAHDAASRADAAALVRLRRDLEEAEPELEGIERNLTEIAERLERERARRDELEALLPALEADEAAEADAARSRGELRASLDARAASLASRRQDLEVRNAGLLDRQRYLEQRLAEVERRLTADAEARRQAAERRLAVERSITALDALAAFVDTRRQMVEARHVALVELRRRQSDEVRGISARLDAVRRRRTAVDQELEALRERSRRLDVAEAETRTHLEGALEALSHDHGVDPEVAAATPAPELPEGTSPQARLAALERELRAMGPINPLALEEFNELKERHTFLEAQLEDVRDTRRELLRVIKAIDVEIQTVFGAAYADVSRHFSELFASLFPGGTGRLVLTSPDDLLNTGIEVEAKPSGKNVKKLSLLSGGERSLTALAFLFAVFRSRPSPFYVMDEVEAALDDVNLHRFLNLLAEFRQEAQLLVVSHQKRTMEAGDSLLGVSMQPGGSSKVVTERVANRA